MNEPRRRAEPRLLAAYVLHAYDWSESSLVLDLYTREEGRLVAAAKGAKRPYSQMRAVLMPFQLVSVQLSRSKGADALDEVRTLRAAEWAAGSAVLPSSALLGAYYVNELVMKFVPRGAAQPELFDHYHDTLRALANTNAPNGEEAVEDLEGVCASDASQHLQASLRSFELLLLQDLGLLPDLAQDALSGGMLQAGERYTWKPELGLVRAAAPDEALHGAEWIHLRAALMGPHCPALRQACRSPRAALRALLRSALAHHLGGAPLRTRELMQSLRRLGARTTTGATP